MWCVSSKSFFIYFFSHPPHPVFQHQWDGNELELVLSSHPYRHTHNHTHTYTHARTHTHTLSSGRWIEPYLVIVSQTWHENNFIILNRALNVSFQEEGFESHPDQAQDCLPLKVKTWSDWWGASDVRISFCTVLFIHQMCPFVICA